MLSYELIPELRTAVEHLDAYFPFVDLLLCVIELKYKQSVPATS